MAKTMAAASESSRNAKVVTCRSISPTFYEQSFQKHSKANKLTKTNNEQRKAVQNSFIQNAGSKILGRN